MSCIEAFVGKPVLVQLDITVALAISLREIRDGDETFGEADMFFQKNAAGEEIPVPTQFVRGCIEDADETHVLIASTGGDGRTPVRMLLKKANISNITFCVEHVPQGAPRIVMAGN